MKLVVCKPVTLAAAAAAVVAGVTEPVVAVAGAAVVMLGVVTVTFTG